MTEGETAVVFILWGLLCYSVGFWVRGKCGSSEKTEGRDG